MEKEIIKRLIKLRNYYGESVYAFAKSLGIAQPTLLRYESGERKIVNNLLYTLAVSFNVNINWLLTGKGGMFIKKNKNTLKRNKDDTVSDRLSNAGKRLVLIQEKHKLLDKEMAKILEITEKEYIKLVTGEIEFDIKILALLKTNFEVDIDVLLFGE